jgi:hypothetical protein
MDRQTEAALDRSIEGRGHFETILLFKKLIGQLLKHFGVSRKGWRRFFQEFSQDCLKPAPEGTTKLPTEGTNKELPVRISPETEKPP